MGRNMLSGEPGFVWRRGGISFLLKGEVRDVRVAAGAEGFQCCFFV